MSHFKCSSCGKVRRDFNDHFDHHHRHGHHDHFDHHHDHFDQHHGHRDFFCDRFLCDKDFRLRLGGLQGGLNFRLRQLIGCKVKMEIEGDRNIKAKICFVGSDFVEVEVIEELKDNDVDVDVDEDVDKEDEKEKKKRRRKKNKKKKKHKGKSWMIPFESIHFVELDDKDCDCDCDCVH